MRRTIWLLAGVLLCVVALGSDSPKEYDDKITQLDELEGRWQLVAFEWDGSTFDLKSRHEVIARAGKWKRKGDDEAATYTTNASLKPAHLDITSGSGKLKYIYRVEDDTLRIGYMQDTATRPQGFKDEDVTILIFKRMR